MVNRKKGEKVLPEPSVYVGSMNENVSENSCDCPSQKKPENKK